MKREDVVKAGKIIKDIEKLKSVFDEVKCPDSITITFKHGNRTRSGTVSANTTLDFLQTALSSTIDQLDIEILALGVEPETEKE